MHLLRSLLVFTCAFSPWASGNPEPSINPKEDSNIPLRKVSDAPIGKIIININAKGIVSRADKTILKTDEDIVAYIQECKAKLSKRNLVPKLHLRGVKDSLFKHSRHIIRLSAQQNVIEVTFVPTDKPLRKQAKKGAPPEPGILIQIDASDRILLNSGPGQEILDVDPKKRELPLLEKRLKAYTDTANTTGTPPHVRLRIAPKANHQRVVDVLNSLAKLEIELVTLEDSAIDK